MVFLDTVIQEKTEQSPDQKKEIKLPYLASRTASFDQTIYRNVPAAEPCARLSLQH